MANRERGEVTLAVGGQTYVLVLDLNAICELEDLLSTPEKPVYLGEVAAQAGRTSGKAIRAILWAAFRRHHPEMTLDAVGDLIKLGDFGAVTTSVMSLLKTATADPEDAAELNKGKRPLKAQPTPTTGDGTGDSSISKVAAAG